MNTAEARTLVNLERCNSIEIHPATGGGWSLWLGADRELPQSGWLETSRGEVRVFSNLDTAYAYVRGLGWDMSIALM